MSRDELIRLLEEDPEVRAAARSALAPARGAKALAAVEEARAPQPVASAAVAPGRPMLPWLARKRRQP